MGTPKLAIHKKREYNRFKMERREGQTLSAPIGVQWEITSWCNEKCVHCYNFWKKDAIPPSRISTSTPEIWQRTAEAIIQNNIFYTIITGGEPLAVLKEFYPFLLLLNQRGVEVRLNSNLTMLTEDKAKLLKKAGIKSVLTSLTSCDPKTNAELTGIDCLKSIERGIKTSLGAGLRTSVNMVVTKKNFNNIVETAQYAKSLGIRSFSATRAATPARGIDFSEYAISNAEYLIMLKELLQVRDKLGMHVDSLEFYPPCSFDSQEMANAFGNRSCTAGRTTCTIDFDGTVRPCPHSPDKFGSVTENGGLETAWRQMLPWREPDQYLPTECNNCNSKLSCRGGCRVEAQCRSGNFNSPDPLSNFSQTPFKKEAKTIVHPDLPNEQGFFFNPNLKSRNEQFGGILFANLSNWIAVDRNLLGFYTEFRNRAFSMNNLAKALNGGSKEVRKTTQYLLQRVIIQKGGD